MTPCIETNRIAASPGSRDAAHAPLAWSRLVPWLTPVLMAGLVLDPLPAADQGALTVPYAFNASQLSANTTGSYTSVATYGDSIYYAYITTGNELFIGRHGPDGPDTITKLADVRDDKTHNRPCVAVDKDGYVHVAGGMHNGYSAPGNPAFPRGWLYFRSHKPNDVSAFDRIDLPSGDATYYYYWYDADDELYMSFRQLIHTASGQRKHAGALARYDRTSGTYRMIGSRIDGSSSPVIVWDRHGAYENGWYNQTVPIVYFDSKNRMHLVSAILGHDQLLNTPGIGSNPAFNKCGYLLYAYSDDAGRTFHRADGGLIDGLPLTVDNATIVADRSAEGQRDIMSGGHSYSLGVLADGSPVIGYSLQLKQSDQRGAVNEAAINVRWDGSKWSQFTIPGADPASWHLVARRNGQCLWYSPAYAERQVEFFATDDARHWRICRPEGADGFNRYSHAIDARYFEETGCMRWQVFHFSASLHGTASSVETFGSASEPCVP